MYAHAIYYISYITYIYNILKNVFLLIKRKKTKIHIIKKEEERSNLPSYNITTRRRKITIKEQIIGKKLNITKRKKKYV